MTRFKMTKIATDQFAILNEAALKDVTIDTSLQFVNHEKGNKIDCKAGFQFSDGQEKAMLLNVTCTFEINKEDWNALAKEDGDVVIPHSLLQFFAVHTIGTARGILHCKTEGTALANIIIPPLNIDGHVKDDLVLRRIK